MGLGRGGGGGGVGFEWGMGWGWGWWNERGLMVYFLEGGGGAWSYSVLICFRNDWKSLLF